MTKKIFIKTFGCQMNEYDSDQISNLMGKMDNYQPTDQVEDADLVVLINIFFVIFNYLFL